MATDQVARNTAADANRSVGGVLGEASRLYGPGAFGSNVGTGAEAQAALSSIGTENVALGYRAQWSMTTAAYNVAVGSHAQFSMTDTSGYNVAVGREVQYTATDAAMSNTGVGYRVQKFLTSAHSNTGVGYQSQLGLTTGHSNSALGHSAQYALTTGTYNVSAGYYSGQALTSGEGNAFVGTHSGGSVTTGSYNAALGRDAGYTDGTTATTAALDYTTCLGYRAQATRANVTVIGSELAAERQTLCLGNYDGLGAGGLGDIALADAQTVPSVDPTGGGVLYSEAGALKWRGSSGTITTIAVA